MNKYKEAIKVVDAVLHHMCGEEREDGYLPTMEEMFNSMDLLTDLANKANSFEWIPVSEKLPDEHDSVFAKSYGTDKWSNAFWRTTSNRVIAAIKYNDGTVIVKEAFTRDGEWTVEKKNINCKVIAWMPFPNPYKENVNETR
jgi:hypothetical protein